MLAVLARKRFDLRATVLVVRMTRRVFSTLNVAKLEHIAVVHTFGCII
jgi:hypothetical protein